MVHITGVNEQHKNTKTFGRNTLQSRC